MVHPVHERPWPRSSVAEAAGCWGLWSAVRRLGGDCAPGFAPRELEPVLVAPCLFTSLEICSYTESPAASECALPTSSAWAWLLVPTEAGTAPTSLLDPAVRR